MLDGQIDLLVTFLKNPKLVVFYHVTYDNCYLRVTGFNPKCYGRGCEQPEPGFYMEGLKGYAAAWVLDYDDFKIYRPL